jgi:hypothetical protein
MVRRSVVRWRLVSGAFALAAASAGALLACGTFGSAGDPQPVETEAASEAGSLDVGTPTDAAAARFCDGFDASPDSSFCADFDGVDWKAGWDPAAQVIGGTLERDTNGFSPPAAFRSTTVGDLLGPHAAPLAIIFPLNNAAKTAHARFKLRIPASHPSTFAHFLAVRFGSKFVQFTLAQEGAKFFLAESSIAVTDAAVPPEARYPIAFSLASGAWIDVDLRISVPGQIHLELDGTTVLQTAVTIADASPPNIIFYAGLYSTPTDASWTASYDNVLFDVQ